MNSSECWFHIAIKGRPQAAEQIATEAAMLGMDILLFWALYLGIDPEDSALSLPIQSVTNRMSTFQFVPGKEFRTKLEAPARVPYRLDASRIAKLTALPEFEQIRLISNKPEPNQVEEKFLLGIQQFAEATRLPSATLKLVWYWSALETVLKKDNSEGSNITNLKLRIKKLLSEQAATWAGQLYGKRGKPVHSGQRNRITAELVTEIDLHRARLLAYLGIVQTVRRIASATSHDAFLDGIDAS